MARRLYIVGTNAWWRWLLAKPREDRVAVVSAIEVARLERKGKAEALEDGGLYASESGSNKQCLVKTMPRGWRRQKTMPGTSTSKRAKHHRG